MLLAYMHVMQTSVGLACIIREETAEGILGDVRSPKALQAA
jgi:hypothetical protein